MTEDIKKAVYEPNDPRGLDEPFLPVSVAKQLDLPGNHNNSEAPLKVSGRYITKEYDVPVLCYGLRADFRMQGFPGSTRLLQIADDIEELKTICKCGAKATQNLRIQDDMPVFDGQQVIIDGATSARYEGVCGKCYIKLKRGKR